MINIRVEKEFRDKVRLWGRANNVEVATLLYQVLHNLIDGKLTVEQLTEPVDEDKLSKLESKLTEEIHRKIDEKLPSLSKLEKAIALVDEYEAALEKVETLARHNREMEAELMAAGEKIEQLTQQYKESKVGTYPEDTIKRMDSSEVTETEKLKDEIPDKVRSLPTGTELTGKQLAELIGVDPSYLSKYKSGKITPPAWFWDNFEAIGKGNKSRWVKK